MQTPLAESQLGRKSPEKPHEGRNSGARMLGSSGARKLWARDHSYATAVNLLPTSRFGRRTAAKVQVKMKIYLSGRRM